MHCITLWKNMPSYSFSLSLSPFILLNISLYFVYTQSRSLSFIFSFLDTHVLRAALEWTPTQAFFRRVDTGSRKETNSFCSLLVFLSVFLICVRAKSRKNASGLEVEKPDIISMIWSWISFSLLILDCPQPYYKILIGHLNNKWSQLCLKLSLRCLKDIHDVWM